MKRLALLSASWLLFACGTAKTPTTTKPDPKIGAEDPAEKPDSKPPAEPAKKAKPAEPADPSPPDDSTRPPGEADPDITGQQPNEPDQPDQPNQPDQPQPTTPAACPGATAATALDCFAAKLTALSNTNAVAAEDRSYFSDRLAQLATRVAAAPTDETQRNLACSTLGITRLHLSTVAFKARRDGIINSNAEFDAVFGPSIAASEALGNALNCP